MSTQISTNNIESYISDLLDDDSFDHNADQQCQIHRATGDATDTYDHEIAETAVLPDDNKYLSFAVGGSDFLVPACEVISVKSLINEQGYRNYRLYSVNALLDPGGSMGSGQARFVLILRGTQDYAISVDTVHGLVSVPAERLLIRKKITDRPWYTAISRDFQSALLNSYMLGEALCEAS